MVGDGRTVSLKCQDLAWAGLCTRNALLADRCRRLPAHHATGPTRGAAATPPAGGTKTVRPTVKTLTKEN